MSINNKRAFGLITIGVLFIFFMSDVILREASVSSLKTKQKNIDGLISSLPGFLRARIKARLELIELKDAIIRAKNDHEKIVAMSALAAYSTNEYEKAKLYSEILQMPRKPESYSAVCFFLGKETSAENITINEYYKFISECPVLDRYSLWTLGLQELKDKNKTQKEQFDFLLPLLFETPEFSDYRPLYKTLYHLASKFDDKDKAKRADELSTICDELPSINTELKKLEKEKTTVK